MLKINTAVGLQDTKECEIKEITLNTNTSTLENSDQPHLNPNCSGWSSVEMLVSRFPSQASCCFSMLLLQSLSIRQVPRIRPWGHGGGGLGPPPVHKGVDGGENPLERVEDFPHSLHVSPNHHHHPDNQEEGATDTPRCPPNGGTLAVSRSVSRVGEI